MSAFTTKDSGQRSEFETGMVRDTQEGKPRFDLILMEGIPYEEQMLTRFAELMARGAVKYTERNHELARTQVELNRARASALRHAIQWFLGETDEDHGAAVMFNITSAERIKFVMRAEQSVELANELARGHFPSQPKCGVFSTELRALCVRPPLHEDAHLAGSGEAW